MAIGNPNLVVKFGQQVFPWVYRAKALPGPGVENTAFYNEALPFLTPIGAGVSNQRQWWWQVPLMMQPHLIGIDGIGGRLHGQVYGAPLTDVTSGQFTG